jgi:hypothetical protein
MPTPVDLHSIDLSALTNVPSLTVTGYVSLVKALAQVQPPTLPDHVNRAFKRMQATRELAEKAIVARLGDDVDLGLERSFDFLTDRVWTHVRDLLAFWAIYRHEGVALFTPQQRAELDIEECQELAAIADDLGNRLFGSEGTDFLRLAFLQQATHMAGRLQLIADKGLGERFEQLVGPRTVKLLQLCQQRYEAMVNARSAREGGVVGNLHQHRASLHRAIQLYALAVVGMLDEEDVVSLDTVQRALIPLVVTRLHRRVGVGGGGEIEGVDELAGADPEGEPAALDASPRG